MLIFAILRPAFGEDPIVYITKTGTKYHTEDCSYLRSSKIAIRLSEALERGLEPGSRCNPPEASSVSQRSDSQAAPKIPPGIELPYFEETDTILYYTGFTLKYNERYEQAEWVAYQLTDDEVWGTLDRADNFRADRSISTESASLSDYKGAGYGRGHLAPAADMKWAPEAMSESFLMSNMSPQDPGFNRGIWKKLEGLIRDWAVDNEEIYVVTGPILTAIREFIHKSLIVINRNTDLLFSAILTRMVCMKQITVR